MTQVAVATTSQLAADAAREVASLGGNAVDCALAASLLAMNTEPGVCALAGGAYVTVSTSNSDPVTIDGNVAVPGLGAGQSEPAIDTVTMEYGGRTASLGIDTVTMEYGGGVTTLVGPASVGVPGSLAAVRKAWQRYGSAPWSDILAPSIRAASDGFPLPSACHYYLGYSGKAIFGRTDDGYHALHEGDELRAAGSRILVPHLADSLSLIAEEGARAFYEGELAVAMVEHCAGNGGTLSIEDLRNYRAIERPALQAPLGSWQIATNPPPAVGGVVLTAMLGALSTKAFETWDRAALGRLIAVQQAVLGYRKRHLDLADDVGAAGEHLLSQARSGQLLSRWASSSTVHTSAVDDQGTGCSITASSGYGSGEMPRATGLWLNNCLGELELNRRGLDAGPVGSRLPSNMAPSVATCKDRVLAVGSPGADRITTAIHQFLVNALQLGMPLADAIAHPRIHIDTSGKNDRLAAEAGLELPDVELPLQVFPELNMYFGGVGAASFDLNAGFVVAADPRREGGTCICDG